MPIENDVPGTYIPTIDEFLAHWGTVNSAGTEITLAGGYTRENLQDDRAGLDVAITAIIAPLNARDQAASLRDARRAAMADKITAFNRAMRDRLAGSIYIRNLPKAISTSAGRNVILESVDDMRNTWATVNGLPATGNGSVPGFTPPLVLPTTPPYTLALTLADRTALDDIFVAVNDAERALTQARDLRNAQFPNIRTRLQQYRRAILGRFPPDSPFVASLPAYSPPPGSTPDAVNLSGVWIPGANVARLTWTPSDRPTATYSIRYCSGGVYRTKDEASVEAGIPINILTRDVTTGLLLPGSTTSFKVYVVTADGNEKGSNAVKITRP